MMGYARIHNFDLTASISFLILIMDGVNQIWYFQEGPPRLLLPFNPLTQDWKCIGKKQFNFVAPFSSLCEINAWLHKNICHQSSTRGKMHFWFVHCRFHFSLATIIVDRQVENVQDAYLIPRIVKFKHDKWNASLIMSSWLVFLELCAFMLFWSLCDLVKKCRVISNHIWIRHNSNSYTFLWYPKLILYVLKM